MRALQVFSGLGAGNIGDEFMARAFWRQLPPAVVLDVELDAKSSEQRAPYPPPHRYLLRGRPSEPSLPGWIVGTTPVTEAEGPGWPLGYLADALRPLHRAGLPVHAVGVGADLLESRRARKLFQEAFAPVRSWTVRSRRCYESLVSMGIDGDQIGIGADWAWLYQPHEDLSDWAAAHWKGLGLDPARLLIVVNAVNLRWRGLGVVRKNLAAALDDIALRTDSQIAFFCNESRSGSYYDFAAASDVMSRLHCSCAIVPNKYYSPDETLALLRHATVTIGQRYHFILQSILAGVVPIAILRGQKMRSLIDDTGTPVGGRTDSIDKDILVSAVMEALAGLETWAPKLVRVRNEMAVRAERNLDGLKRFGL